MKIKAPNIILLWVFILMISTCTWAQDKELPEPQMNALDGPGPPPPGLPLPLDTNIFILLVAGLGLGIYFLTASGKKSTSIH
ncbi:MAG TPA: hypothetical protein VFD29_03530 [Gillisia sp.]|nr:hypothetical protein [Gillisia sp.]